jgi:hypothetical protein
MMVDAHSKTTEELHDIAAKYLLDAPRCWQPTPRIAHFPILSVRSLSLLGASHAKSASGAGRACFKPSQPRASAAATHNNSPMIGLLLQSGANPDLENDQGETALEVAKLNGNLEAVQAIAVLSNTRSAAPSGSS